MGKNLYLFSKKLRNVTKIVYPLITLYELIKTFAVNNLRNISYRTPKTLRYGKPLAISNVNFC